MAGPARANGPGRIGLEGASALGTSTLTGSGTRLRTLRPSSSPGHPRRGKVVAGASFPPPGDSGEDNPSSADRKQSFGDIVDVLSSNLRKTAEHERDRLMGDMDSLVQTSDVKIEKDIKSVSKEENWLLNAWTGTGFSLVGGAAVVALLILFVFIIGPPPQKV